MLETVSKGFRSARNRIMGFQELTEANVDEALRDIRVSLLEADVEFHVVKRFLDRVKATAIGELVKTRATAGGKKITASPGEHFVKICHDELEALMGPADTSLAFATTGLTKIMMVGLQGSGKTTTSGKLARMLEREHEKRCCLVAADVYRPAAVEQLRVLGERLGLPVYHREGASPPEICAESIAFAGEHNCDVVIFDTAGRLALDDALMEELESIKSQTQPDNILLVCDAMIGQDAVTTASEFNRRIAFDGVVLTKLDGDARGGAALSIKEVTGKPIKFVGMGEGLDRLEAFRPDGIADRILGFGDIVGLMQDFESVVDEQKAEEDAKKILSGQFNMTHFLDQIRTIKKMGSLKDLMDKMPFFSDGLPEGMELDDRELGKVEAMISSMTKSERTDPDILDESRIKRVAGGSGRSPEDVGGLLERFRGMRQVMGNIGKNPGLLSRIPGLRQLSQLKQLKGGDVGDMLGDLSGGMGEFAGASRSQLSRHAGQLKRSGQPIPPELKRALSVARAGQEAPKIDADALARKRDRRRKDKQARKKDRKRR